MLRGPCLEHHMPPWKVRLSEVVPASLQQFWSDMGLQVLGSGMLENM